MKKHKKKNSKKKNKDIDLDEIMLKNRTLFLSDDVKFKVVEEIAKKIYALDKINHNNITLYISTYGGIVETGIAVIDAIEAVKSKVTTIITGGAYSMGSIISVCGNKRLMTRNSVWMAHPIMDGIHDYSEFIKDRIKSLNILDKITTRIYKQYTNLSNKELKFTKRGELWLGAEECLEKGIIDKII